MSDSVRISLPLAQVAAPAPAPPSSQPAPVPDPPAIAYESAVETESNGPRPRWVYPIVGIYVLIVGVLSVLPLVLPLLDGGGFSAPLLATATVLILCEVALLFVPVRLASRRPITRRALWIPLLGSALLAGLLGFGGSLAFLEFLDRDWPNSQIVLILIFGTAGAFWLAWTVVFWVLSLDRGPENVAMKLHRWLLAGSVLELLVAVPTHVVVRRRSDCCAGIGTGAGICAGIIVMLLAFGPSVGFLYYRRWKKIRQR